MGKRPQAAKQFKIWASAEHVEENLHQIALLHIM
jgi:hypothetical protein